MKDRNFRLSFYGEAILSNGLMGSLPKIKNKVLSGIQHPLLKHFGQQKSRGIYPILFSKAARKIIGPYIYSIKLEVNNLCNLDCEMCYVPKGEIELPMSAIDSLYHQISHCGVRLEILGGEPLMRDDICPIVKKAKSIARSPYISLYTNGTFATPELSNDLKLNGLDAAIVTLVSGSRDVHDRFTGVPGSWAKTILGIANLKAAGVTTFTFTAVHSKNLNEIKGLYEYVKDTLGVHPLFYQYIPQRIDDPLRIDSDRWYEIKNWILSKVPDHAEFVRDFYMLTGNACSGGNFVLTVKVDGSVQPCPFVTNLPLGNIRDRSIWDIYRHRYRSGILKPFKKVPESCKSCTYVSVCAGGCRAGNDKLFGTYDSCDFRCKGPYTDLLEKDKVVLRTPGFF